MHQKIIICVTITSYKKIIKICLIFTKEIVFVDVSQTFSGITIIAWRQPQNVVFSIVPSQIPLAWSEAPALACILQFVTAFALLN